MSDLIIKITSEGILDEAFQWLCKHRENLSHNNDVWELRRHWQQVKAELQQTLLRGEYSFNPLVEVRYGENYRDVSKGISMGCPLSPFMATLFLKPLDDAMRNSGLFYVRFMDDWIVIAPTRWKLRKAVKQVNVVLDELLLEKHPDKTFIGKASKGFTFLGYLFTP